MRLHPFVFAALLALFPLASHSSSLPGLPENVEAREGMPAIESILGFEPGQRHPHNHELVSFYRRLAESSDRMQVESIGESAGGREQVLVYFGAPDNLDRLAELRDERIGYSRSGTGPVVVWLGYSVHGNEASGASAAALVAWYLAASNDPLVEQWLAEMVIVMEPVVNPDGLDRFAHWVNMHRGRNPSGDPNDREHNEAWPNGRTSYYWFDLNRDWLPLTHAVSRNRIEHYRRWRPHVLTDAHEMGHRSTYFFQPGVPERNNPATPQRVYDLTAAIAEFHASGMDAAGEMYYSRESFDDYYLGKGSTYPDLTGGIGILFEQGSARGHVMDTPYGERTFADAIANQVRTSLSTLEASAALGEELIAHQQQFFTEGRQRAGGGGWLLGDDGDPARAARLIDILLGHGIEVRPVDGEVSIAGRNHAQGHAWVVPASQDQHRFIAAIFDTPTELPMDTFYDVSAWPLQHAFDLPFQSTSRLPATGSALKPGKVYSDQPTRIDPDALAWVVNWRQHHAPAMLAALLADGYRVQAISEPMELDGNAGPIEFDRGSFLVHSGIQPAHLAPVHERIAVLARRHDVATHSINRGLALSGLDMGSPSAPVLDAPSVALLTGDGVSSYAAGYVWRWFDVHLDQPVTRLEPANLPSNLDDYTHLILPNGRYDRQPDSFKRRLVEFVEGGGQLIALTGAAEWVESLDLDWSFADAPVGTNDDENDSTAPDREKRYSDYEQDFARTLIGGSALAMELDTSHPLGFGYTRDRITVFRQGAHVLRRTDNVYARPGRYTAEPLVAGYLAEPVTKSLAGTSALAADRFGRGLVVRIADDYVFRGYWAGTEKILANAIFYGQLIGPTRMPE